MSAHLAILDDADTAAAVLSPIRRRILEALGEPGSATTVGDAIGLPRQKVNYHLRTLEEAGLVEHVEDRRKGNCTERIVQATATHYLIAPSVLGALGATPTERADAFSSDHLAAVSARTISEVAELRKRAAEAGKRLPTFSLETAVCFSTPADQAAFLEDISNHIAGLVARYHDESSGDGRWFRLALGSHPALEAAPQEKDDDDDE